ncbi:hypothetical protein BESB_059060 [Besnoitia besnoiti]|uniref:Uncharacterized protein n=1 Tax=Besnoitia besnoiti TaxID=94643 RepID=A0A2A9MAV8_BESBE|nr:hypothetical protein BESB_059060 [Besnoitia besnoiti]PFH35019.1 hypothetical protein BESB_059060 [Besnoitia besnoiti]
MEFPAFRSEEWMKSAFAPVPEASLAAASERPALGPGAAPQVSPREQAKAPLAPSERAAEAQAASASAFPPLFPPEFCFRGFDPMPAYLASFPTAGLYLQRVRQVRWSIKRALFRQSLFKIQNVEVLEMKRCKRPRRLLSSEILYDAEAARRQASPASSPKSSEPSADAVSGDTALAAPSPSSGDRLPLESSAAPADTSASSLQASSFAARLARWRRETRERRNDEEVLREELWKVDRCGSIRDYRVVVSRDRETRDFFSVSVHPVAWSDKVRQRYFNFFDQTAAQE